MLSECKVIWIDCVLVGFENVLMGKVHTTKTGILEKLTTEVVLGT